MWWKCRWICKQVDCFQFFWHFLCNDVIFNTYHYFFFKGLSHQYPYSENSCHLYEYLVEASPLHSAILLLLLVYYSYSYSSPTPTTTSCSSMMAPLPAILAGLISVAIGKLSQWMRCTVAEWLQRLIANAKVATVLSSIPASSDSIKSDAGGGWNNGL